MRTAHHLLPALAVPVLFIALNAPAAFGQPAPNPSPGPAWAPPTEPVGLGRCGAPVEAVPCADAPVVDEQGTAAPGPYAKGRCTLQLLSGAYFAPTIFGPPTPAFDLLPQTVRVGWICNTPREDATVLRGCLELLLDEMAEPVARGPGNIITGPSALLRWNFVQPNASLIPYIQGGTGILWDDVAQHDRQSGIGGDIEFLLQAEVGVHYLVSDHWALDLESGFVHISNAGTAKYNGGINAPGASIGVTYYFRSR